MYVEGHATVWHIVVMERLTQWCGQHERRAVHSVQASVAGLGVNGDCAFDLGSPDCVPIESVHDAHMYSTPTLATVRWSSCLHMHVSGRANDMFASTCRHLLCLG